MPKKFQTCGPFLFDVIIRFGPKLAKSKTLLITAGCQSAALAGGNAQMALCALRHEYPNAVMTNINYRGVITA